MAKQERPSNTLGSIFVLIVVCISLGRCWLDARDTSQHVESSPTTEDQKIGRVLLTGEVLFDTPDATFCYIKHFTKPPSGKRKTIWKLIYSLNTRFVSEEKEYKLDTKNATWENDKSEKTTPEREKFWKERMPSKTAGWLSSAWIEEDCAQPKVALTVHGCLRGEVVGDCPDQPLILAAGMTQQQFKDHFRQKSTGLFASLVLLSIIMLVGIFSSLLAEPKR